MKSAAVTHPKIHRFAAAIQTRMNDGKLHGTPFGACLNIAIGTLQHFWQHVGTHMPTGDITEATPASIAHATNWLPNDAEWLLEAFIEHRLVDRWPDGRLIVHNWSTHCEEWVHTKLARMGLDFADGTPPKNRRLKAEERDKTIRPGAHTATRRAPAGAPAGAPAVAVLALNPKQEEEPPLPPTAGTQAPGTGEASEKTPPPPQGGERGSIQPETPNPEQRGAIRGIVRDLGQSLQAPPPPPRRVFQPAKRRL